MLARSCWRQTVETESNRQPFSEEALGGKICDVVEGAARYKIKDQSSLEDKAMHQLVIACCMTYELTCHALCRGLSGYDTAHPGAEARWQLTVTLQMEDTEPVVRLNEVGPWSSVVWVKAPYSGEAGRCVRGGGSLRQL
ncbi:hypothetical protein NDU88_005182 [Pleurodeles waltl]|uniref:Uncharacterized protein n=1 Tax=Pleurodeles waltl TaxID=8319 RepID=A0AAV7N0H3_PLEWA|nr:hypothetical protein NDU88_005182 [Pleurodeles waltl]